MLDNNNTKLKKRWITLNIIAGGLLILALLAISVSIVIRSPIIYILCFVSLTVTILFGLLVFVPNLLWKLLPRNFKKTHAITQDRLFVTVLISVPLFFLIAGWIQRSFFSNASSVICFDINLAIFIFALFSMWSLIKQSKWTTRFIGLGIFVFFTALLSFAGSITLQSSNVAKVDTVQVLNSLPYVSLVSAGKGATAKKEGVTVYDPNLTFDGLNLYACDVTPQAQLIDMKGNIVNQWNIPGSRWTFSEMCENGDILVVFTNDRMLMQLDWDSNIKIRQKKMRFHHAVTLDANKDIYTLARNKDLVFWGIIPIPILNDCVVVLSPEGELKKKVYIYDMVKNYVPSHYIPRIHKWLLSYKNLRKCFQNKSLFGFGSRGIFDILHTNNIEVMNRDITGFCRKGDWLISLRNLDLVFIYDVRQEKVTWSWGPGEISRQHHAQLLDNGNILIFDNGPDKGFSRIIELNPLTKEIVWEYKSDPPKKFFTNTRGSCQRLPNGNTLITESNRGRVFEVTKEGKVENMERPAPDCKGRHDLINRCMRQGGA